MNPVERGRVARNRGSLRAFAVAAVATLLIGGLQTGPSAVAQSPPCGASGTISVVDDLGGRVVIHCDPFGLEFRAPDGRAVLRHVPAPGIPAAQGNADPEPGGFDNVPETAWYAPLSFHVGPRRDLQQPGGLWTGDMVTGVEGAVVHSATRVVEARRKGAAAVLRVATTDPARDLEVVVSPDVGSSFRVRARPTPDVGVTAFGDSFRAGRGEAFRGFGGRHNALDQAGNDFYNWIEEEAFGAGPLKPLVDPFPGSGGEKYLFPGGPEQAYYVQNLFHSSAGYGFLLNRTEVSRWRMASERPDAWQVTVRSPSVDYTVAVGPPIRTVAALTAINGRHRVPPRWAIGPAVKRNVQQGNSDPERQMELITADLRRIRELKLRLDGYSYESWDTLPDAFVRETNRRLRSMGIRAIGYVRAYVNDDGNFDPPGTFMDAVSRGLVARTPAGTPFVSVAVGPAALLDFTNPDTLRWWEERKIRPMLDMGFEGFMQDFGEQALDDMVFHDGSTGVEMHNRYPIVFHRETRRIVDAYERSHPGRGPIWMYTRSGFSGRPGSAAYESSNFPGDETGDWQPAIGLPSLAPDMLNRAVGGAYGYTTDIGGYFDSFTADVLDTELFSRWMEWSALSPHFRLHNSCCTNGTRMPWDFDPETLRRWRHLSDLHRRATPLISRLWREAFATGIPITRPLWLAFPQDRRAAAIEQQWMLGPDVLVAPVVEKGARERAVYFPRGCWRHGESGTRYRGPAEATVPAPLGALPWFERCGKDPIR